MTMTRPKPVELKTELEHIAERCGECHSNIEGRYAEMKKLLLQAKKAVGHGKWMQWLSDNKNILGFGHAQAKVYMLSPESRARQLKKAQEHQKKIRDEARVGRESKALADKAAKAEAELSSFIALAVAPIDYDRTKVALDIVSAGYKAMSLKSHPDVGGTADLQTALTGARDWLVTLINNPLFATGDK